MTNWVTAAKCAAAEIAGVPPSRVTADWVKAWTPTNPPNRAAISWLHGVNAAGTRISTVRLAHSRKLIRK